MPLKVVVGAAEKEAVRADIYVGTAKKRVTRIECYDGSAWKLVQSFAPPISLSVTPSVSGTGNSTGVTLITSSTAYATPTGGTSPYTYAWTKVGGDTMTATNPTSASTAFRLGVGPGDSKSATYRCTVTDSLGQTASGTVNITLTNTSGV